MRIKYISLFLLIMLLGYFLIACEEDSAINLPSTGSNLYTIPEETSDGWETASLSSVGMNIPRLEALLNNLNNNTYNEVHSVVVVKDDKLKTVSLI